jgi:hypothetical protein
MKRRDEGRGHGNDDTAVDSLLTPTITTLSQQQQL